MRARFSRDRVELRLAAAEENAFRGAAYAMTAFAFVALGASGRARTAVLFPKSGGKLQDLAKRFSLEYENQKLRWRLLRLNRKVSADVIALALALPADESAGGGVPAESLSEERRREIAQALREAQGEAWDPLGIARPWEELKRGARDPLR